MFFTVSKFKTDKSCDVFGFDRRVRGFTVYAVHSPLYLNCVKFFQERKRKVIMPVYDVTIEYAIIGAIEVFACELVNNL
jgi:hypothetical protein